MVVNNKYAQLSQWISDLLENKISEEDFLRLQQLIESDPTYMRYYIEYVSVCAMMEKRSLEGSLRYTVDKGPGSKSPEDTAEIILKLMAEEEGAESINQQESYDSKRPVAQRQTSLTSFRLPTLIKKAAAIILICFGILQIDDLIVNYQPEEPLPKLARITEQFDYCLKYKGEELVSDKWLWPGDYHLSEGFMSLRYHSGAVVVLEAPVVFRLESFDTVYLSYGKLFANVPHQARGFTINTDNAKVMDLGTEFGVDVSLEGDTDLYVYKGKTALVCNNIESADASQMITSGSARGIAFNSNKVKEIDLQESIFVRSIDADGKRLWRGKNISLADIVGGGDGFGTGEIEVGIDPSTGKRGDYAIFDRNVENGYVTIPEDRYIDGVFVPCGDIQKISSLNHVFNDCPVTNNVHYADIICGTGIGSEIGSQDELMIIDGVQYGIKSRPGLSLHANLGITFDLGKIREDLTCYNIDISKFTANIGISDFAPNDPHAVFWVLIDGGLCFSKVLDEKGVSFPVDVEIADSDRFLTIVVTDGEDIDAPDLRSSNSDWCVVAEPELSLELK